ncbi:hypothetical protein B296_00014587 [Ensete ventricosum]|uniref:Uncharacterized protein n=1 Tax=Ensete ventricosum TaxID=4639 RepID=A0A426ZD20_ENSVE|nr:hypothetical protein B296_00014587 [Ensete ventricosum]
MGGSGDWREVAAVRAASRGGDWRGAVIVAGDGCGCGEEVGQRWIRQLAVVVEMRGKEGTAESKGRRGCSGSKEASTGKKGEEERWQMRLRQRRECVAWGPVGGDNGREERNRGGRWRKRRPREEKVEEGLVAAEAAEKRRRSQGSDEGYGSGRAAGSSEGYGREI